MLVRLIIYDLMLATVYNVLMAYAVGDILGIDEDKIKEEIGNFKLINSRLERKIKKMK